MVDKGVLPEEKGPRAFVTGYPVRHSRSPQIHRSWLQQYAISGQYDPIEVAPENFAGFIGSLAKDGFCGGNVTLPHKEEAFRLADQKDSVATMIGAANTLWFENGRLCASNTDAYGFAANLDDFAPGWAGGIALVLGAGGASRAVIYALKQRGFERICLLNRTRARADDLAMHFGQPVEAHDWQDVNKLVHAADLIVNTTSLGMENHMAEKSDTLFLNFDKAKSTALVTDIVYTPLITPVLQQARDSGLKIVDGIGMLLHQAVPGFERWFGVRPHVDEALRLKILRDMGEA
ncbi:shikimate dehydrogenase [Bartonella sp. LJL80]